MRTMPTTIVNRIRPGDGDPRHGTPGGYSNHRCHCGACRTAHAAYHRRYRRRRRLRAAGAEDLAAWMQSAAEGSG